MGSINPVASDFFQITGVKSVTNNVKLFSYKYFSSWESPDNF